MDTVKVIHDREGQTLTVWFGKPSSEVSSSDNEHGVVVMKDRRVPAQRSAVRVESLPGITLEKPMATVSVTSKGQVTIPKPVRRALGITPGSKVAFDVEGGGARLRLVKRQAPSRIEDGPAILNYTGPRIPIAQMQGGIAMKKAGKRARG